MSSMVWKKLSKEERKTLSSIIMMPKFTKGLILKKRSLFLKFLEKMVALEKMAQEDFRLIDNIFQKWDRSNCSRPKEFVLAEGITEIEIDMLFLWWKPFENFLSKCNVE